MSLEEYSPQEIQLARDIATALHDLDSLPMHLKLVRTFTEEHLRRKLNHVMSIPEGKIKKSRAALYMYLLAHGDRHGGLRG